MERRDALRHMIGAVLAPFAPIPASDQMVDVDVQLIKLDIPSDDRRCMTTPHDVMTKGLDRLSPVPVKMDWDGPDLGIVESWFIQDGWLCATINIPTSVANQLKQRSVVAAPSLYATYTSTFAGVATSVTGAVMVAIVGWDFGMWHEHRS